MDLLSTHGRIPADFFPMKRGESAPAAGLLRVHARWLTVARRESIAQAPGFVKEANVRQASLFGVLTKAPHLS